MLIGAVQLLVGHGAGGGGFFFRNIAFKFKFTSITCIAIFINY